MKYHFRIWCEDCMTVGDTQGCFNGTAEDDDELFDTPEEACITGLKATDACGFYDFAVKDEDNNDVEVDRDALYLQWAHAEV